MREGLFLKSFTALFILGSGCFPPVGYRGSSVAADDENNNDDDDDDDDAAFGADDDSASGSGLGLPTLVLGLPTLVLLSSTTLLVGKVKRLDMILLIV